jgi:hypothetical protein
MKCTYPVRTFKIISGTRYEYEHGCGKCLPCSINKRKYWQSRILLESLNHKASSFITLTYNEANVPQNMELNKDDIKNFFKRLRKNTGTKYRYFAAGEYGGTGGRPHFHVILFGHSFIDPNPIIRAWSKNVGTTRKPVFVPIGNVHLGDITPSRCSYIAKYTTKYAGNTPESHKGKHPEFATMSRRPGLGYETINKIVEGLYTAARKQDKHIRDVFNEQFKSLRICGRRCPIDPYLRKKIERRIEDWEDSGKTIEELIKSDRKREIAKFNKKDFELVVRNDVLDEMERLDQKFLAERLKRKHAKTIKL